MVPKVEMVTGLSLSRLVYGTWRLLDGGMPAAGKVAARLEACAELGITSIDTAEIYGGYTVEKAVGDALRESRSLRDGLEIITKCGIDVPSDEKGGARLPHYNATADNLVACAEKSLKLLGTDTIDLLLVHRPDWLASADETAEGLERLLRSGKVLHVGVSNYTADQFELLQDRLDIPLATNQVEMSLFEMGALYDGTLAQSERLRVRPMAWSPLAGGRLFDPKDAVAVRIRAAIEEMAPRYGDAGMDALAFAWVLAHPSAPLGILGTNKLERVRSSARACEIDLERQDWYALWEAAKGTSVP